MAASVRRSPGFGYCRLAVVLLRRWLVVACLLSLVAATGCPRSPRKHSTDGVTATGNDTFPTDFTPPPTLPPAPPADPNALGAAYLDLLAARIEPGWTQFLEDCRLRLPPSHPLNSPTLEAAVQLVLDNHGAVVSVELTAASGNREFDDAVVGVADDAAPFPPADRALLSDDDQVYLRWQFARDRRQAGAATAKLSRIEWSLERAVPRFLDDGNLSEAARRVAAAPSNAVALAFGERVMIAVVREGLASHDAGVQRLAIAGAAAAKARPAARELRAIADGSMDVELRGAAIAALATIGDVDAVALLAAILERDAGANLELTGQAASALAALGGGAELRAVVTRWFAAGKAGATPSPGPAAQSRAPLWAALIATAGAPVPGATPDLARLVAASEPRVRAAACRALGTAAPSDTTAWKPLGRGLADPDATVRAACASAVATAAGAGGRSRATVWLVVPLLRDRDERVRAGAVLALARLDSKRAQTDLTPLAKDKSALVQASLAEAWARTAQLDRAAALLGSDVVAVRLAAATALGAFGGAPGAARLASHVDSDLAVRLAVLAVTTDRAALTAASADADPAVAAAASRRLTIVDGRAATLPATAAAIATAPAASAARVQLAAAWLAAP